MKILTSYFHDESTVPETWKWETCFHGEALDKRGASSIDYLKKNSKSSNRIVYNPTEFTVSVNDNLLQKDDLEDFFDNLDWTSTIIDSTTIGFVELLLITKYAVAKTKSFDIVYLQPEYYKKKDNSTLTQNREFDITSENPGYQAIPGFSSLLQSDDDNHFVFFAGYETIRLDRAFEDYQMITSENCNVVFGLPAYKAGWENDAFANNISVLSNRKIFGEVKYCGAVNPLATYNLLAEIRKSLDSKANLILAPIGPKPLGIGAALFIASASGVSVLYDHPINKADRTSEVANWFFYKIVNE